MAWDTLLGFALGGANILSGYYTSKFNAMIGSAQFKQQEALAADRNRQREADNELRAAQAALESTLQGINNKRVLEQMGLRRQEASENAARARDDFVKQRAFSEVEDAARLGSLTANAAMAGLAGGSLAQIERTQAIRSQFKRVESDRAADTAAYEQRMMDAGILTSGVSQLDNRLILANLDKSQDLGPQGVDPASLRQKWYGNGLLGAAKTFGTFLEGFDQGAALGKAFGTPTKAAAPTPAASWMGSSSPAFGGNLSAMGNQPSTSLFGSRGYRIL